MLITSGKDSYMKFWHLLPESKGEDRRPSLKQKLKKQKKESSDSGYKQWRGDSEEYESEQETPTKQRTPPKKKKSPSPQKKVSDKKKKVEPQEESSDDDLTGWY